jgi:hypothetical protein
MTDLNPTEAVLKDGVQFGAFKVLMQFYKMIIFPAAVQDATTYSTHTLSFNEEHSTGLLIL